MNDMGLVSSSLASLRFAFSPALDRGAGPGGLRSVLAAVFLCSLAVSSFGNTHVWTGDASYRFSDAANWTGGSPAGDPDADLSFPSMGRRRTINDLAGLTVRSITFSADNYTILGKPISFLEGGQIIASTPGPVFISCNLVLPFELEVKTAGSSSMDAGLTLSGAIFDAGGITTSGAGNLTFSGAISGVGGVTADGTGILILSGAEPNTYTGTTRVTSGRLQLNKSSRLAAFSGPLIAGIAMQKEPTSIEVVTLEDEQIPDNVPITVVNAAIDFGGVETLGELTLDSGTLSSRALIDGVTRKAGRLILGGDVTVRDGFSFIDGDVFLPSSRTITLVAGRGLTITQLDCAPGAIVTISGQSQPDEYSPVASITGTYDNPTVVTGGVLNLNDSSSPVIVRGGLFLGSAASITAEGGQLGGKNAIAPVTSRTDVHLSPAATVFLDLSRGFPAIQLNGTLDLAGARLVITAPLSALPRQWDRSYLVASNTGTRPVSGTWGVLPEGSVIDDRWRISYVGGDGNDLTVSEDGHVASDLSVSADANAVSGKPIAVGAWVRASSTRPVTGTVTVLDGDKVLATATLDGNGKALMTIPPRSRGSYTLTATYGGDSRVTGSRRTFDFDVHEVTPTISSIEPASVAGGSWTMLTIRGTGFVDGSSVLGSGGAETFISSTELHFDYWASSWPRDTIQYIMVRQPRPGEVHSDLFPLLVRARIPVVPEQTRLIFDTQTVSAPVTPGALTAWMSESDDPTSDTFVLYRTALISDDDHDGLVTWRSDRRISSRSSWIVVDLTSNTILAGRPDKSTPEAQPFPPKAFLRDAEGRFSHLILPPLPSPSDFGLLWTRPGVGAWTITGSDRANQPNFGRFNVLEARDWKAVGSSGTTPSGFEPGDSLVALEENGGWWAGDRVDQHLLEATGPGSLTMVTASDPVYCNERDGMARIFVLRTGGSDGAISVRYNTADETSAYGIQYVAVPGTQYVAQAGTLTFGAGEIFKEIDIPLIDDTTYSGPTYFRVLLSSPGGTTITGSAETTVAITDNDSMPLLSLHPSATVVPEGDEGIGTIPVTVRLTGKTLLPVTVRWNASGRTTDGMNSGSLTFAPGETAKSFVVTYRANTTPEADRVIHVYLFNPGGTESTPETWITVLDDDAASVSVSDTSVREGAGSAHLTVFLAKASQETVTVAYATRDGSASAGSDYDASSGVVTFTPGITQRVISIPIVNDNLAEGSETFFLVLSDVKNGHLGNATAAIDIVDDEQPPPEKRRAGG